MFIPLAKRHLGDGFSLRKKAHDLLLSLRVISFRALWALPMSSCAESCAVSSCDEVRYNLTLDGEGT